MPEVPRIQPTAGLLLFQRYRVLRELGRGGMGVVVLAHDTNLGIDVAIKLVPDAVVDDSESIDTVRREVLRGMALNHDGIVRTHTFECDKSGAAIVMEFVEGDTFSDLKQRQPEGCFDAMQILPWLDQLCSILDYAHQEARIVHRDLKPRNIMVTRGSRNVRQFEGRVKVADFGIAAALSDTVSKHSLEGRISGTLSYMSPQQAQGKRPTHLDDIHALGATIYELLTGKPPFFRGNPATIHAQVLSIVPPSIADRREDLEIFGKTRIPIEWEETIAACLAKHPADRPQTAGAVFTRLRRADFNARQTTEDIRRARPVEIPPAPPVPPAPLPPDPPTIPAPQPTRPANNDAIWMAALIILTLIFAGLLWAFTTMHNAVVQVTPSPTPEPVPTTPVPPPPTPEPTPIVLTTPVPVPVQATPVPRPTALRSRPFVNSLGMRFVPAGIDGVFVSVWETRVQDFRTFVKESKYQPTRGMFTLQIKSRIVVNKRELRTQREFDRTVSWDDPGFDQSGNHPVIGVSLIDAREFCRWLSAREHRAGTLPLDSCYAVISDGEWTAATSGLVYPFGDDWPPKSDAGNYGDANMAASLSGSGWRYIPGLDDGECLTAPVGSYRANAFGLYDVGGNVTEWCDTPYRPEMNSKEVLLKWPNLDDECDNYGNPHYTMRGGNWSTFEELALCCDTRDWADEAYRADYAGFRIVLAVTPRSPASLIMRGQLRFDRNEFAGAVEDYSEAIQLNNEEPRAWWGRAHAAERLGRYDQALSDYLELVSLQPNNPNTNNAVAWCLATAPTSSIRSGQKAIAYATKACSITEYKSANELDTLAAAYAEAGDWSQAVRWQNEALDKLNDTGRASREGYEKRLELYRQQQPYHRPVAE